MNIVLDVFKNELENTNLKDILRNKLLTDSIFNIIEICSDISTDEALCRTKQYINTENKDPELVKEFYIHSKILATNDFLFKYSLMNYIKVNKKNLANILGSDKFELYFTDGEYITDLKNIYKFKNLKLVKLTSEINLEWFNKFFLIIHKIKSNAFSKIKRKDFLKQYKEILQCNLINYEESIKILFSEENECIEESLENYISEEEYNDFLEKKGKLNGKQQYY